MALKLSWKVWLLIILLILAVFTIINPKGFEGKVMIKEIRANSSAAEAGMSVGELIKEIDEMPIESLEDYGSAISALEIPFVNFTVKTKENGTFRYNSKKLDFELSNKTICCFILLEFI